MRAGGKDVSTKRWFVALDGNFQRRTPTKGAINFVLAKEPLSLLIMVAKTTATKWGKFGDD